MGSTSDGGDDVVAMARTTPPDEIGIDRGTRCRANGAGFL
jgi:hypothetical protein